MNFGAGLGFVDVFSPGGRLLLHLEHGDWFNAPFGEAICRCNFRRIALREIELSHLQFRKEKHECGQMFEFEDKNQSFCL